MQQQAANRAPIAGLAPVQAAQLSRLKQQSNKRATPHAYGENELGWCRPADVGGVDLRSLVRRGFVDSKSYGGPKGKGGGTFSQIYRISEAGMSAYELYAEHIALQTAEYWQQENTQHRDQLAIERDVSALVP